MSETALSEAAMLTSLRDIRLPVEAPGGLLAELVLTAGMAALAAVCVVAVLRLLSTKRSEAQSDRPDWSDDRRRIALLHLLRKQDAKRYAALKGDLYRPGGGPDLAELEEEVARRV
ncbi:hypothetical protein HW561_12910 [Rhodobacteraceae bacterium B1Z28]|uniref:Uncharacterized protein n=1 Tax=Ruegeria haliotis TaxID=2747601 RepID=A0ABX2PR92_9RHOB|nr:hypothetical protein [Ruegeria haliotis]NVO56685.1 hypothetical protein [Ruegeria haliotis]